MTEQALTRPDPPRFGIGRALAAGFQTIGRGFVPFVIVFLGISAVQFGVIFWLLEKLQSGTPVAWINGGLVLSNTICDAVFNAVMTGIALSVVEDHRADWRRALARLPMVVLQIGLMSLVYASLSRFGIPGVPRLVTMGLILAIGTLTWLYASVLVREGGHPVSALRRNFQLAAGHRLKILALLVIFFVLYFVIGFVIGFIVGVIFSAMGIPITVTVTLGIQLTMTQLLNAYCYIVAASSFHLLVAEKDGPRQAELAQVFD